MRPSSSSPPSVVVSLLLLLWCLPPRAAPRNTLRFPKFSAASMTAATCAHKDLGDARAACASGDLIQSANCSCFDCLATFDNWLTVTTLADAGFCQAQDDVYVASTSRDDFDSEPDPLYSYFGVDDVSSADTFVGCFNRELFTLLADGSPSQQSSLYAIHLNETEPHVVDTVVLREDLTELRIWDLSSSCDTKWQPARTDHGPLGVGVFEYGSSQTDIERVDLRSTAVYCRENSGSPGGGSGGGSDSTDCAQAAKLVFSKDRYDEQKEYFPVDSYYKRSTCLEGQQAQQDGVDFQFDLQGDEYQTSGNCTKRCSEGGYESALVSPSACYCTDASESLYPSLRVMDGCLECNDDDNDPDDPFECGGPNQLSHYFVSERGSSAANHGFDYWQCVRGDLFNVIDQVLPEQLFAADTVDGDPSKCLASCDEAGFAVSMFRNVAQEDLPAPEPGPVYVHRYECYCLSPRYKFRVQDVDFNCLNYWCPGVLGPCAAAGNSLISSPGTYAAVYCKGEDVCGDLLVDNDKSGVCEGMAEGQKIVDSRLLSTEYLYCNYNESTGLHSWRVGSCATDLGFEESVLNQTTGECQRLSAGQYCQQEDSRGITWFAAVGETAVRDCQEDLGEPATGVGTWDCVSSPNFATPEPDRSACQEVWVGTVEELIAANESAKYITSFMLVNLESETGAEYVSGGGLLDLTTALPQVSRLQGEQLVAGTSTGLNEYAAVAYDVVDALLASAPSWLEVSESRRRHAAASVLLRQVDEIGALTIAELEIESNGGDASSSCGEVSSAYFSTIGGTYSLMTAELVRSSTLDAGGSFVFTGENVEVTVPAAFLQTNSDGCGSVVAASLAIDFAGTQMFPDSPPIADDDPMDEDDDDDDDPPDGLQGVIADFTTFSGWPSSPVPFADVVNTGRSSSDFEDDVVIVFDHVNRKTKLPRCTYWVYSQLSWSDPRDESCYLDRRRSTSTTAVCRCSHLTNFAIIFGADDADDKVLSIISVVLGAVSCACFVVTVLMLHLFNHARNAMERRRRAVELNRNYCVLLGQLLFLTVVGVEDRLGAATCSAITAFTHFVWMAAFAWTALEGYLLFLALVVVFPGGNTSGRIWQYYLAGYGVPLLIVSATLAAAGGKGEIIDGYFREDACWLDNHYLWGFTGPVSAVLAMNTLILARGMWEAYKVNKQRHGGDAWAQNKAWMRNFLMLSYLLGVTWVVGYFNHIDAKWPQYTFVVLNASYGVGVLAQAVVFNKKMRETTTHAWRNRTLSTRSTPLSRHSPVSPAGVATADKSSSALAAPKKKARRVSTFDGSKFVSSRKGRY